MPVKLEVISGAVLYGGDALVALDQMRANSFDSCVTDPPYHLVSVVKRFGKKGSAPAKSNGETGVYRRASKGFMGKTWDGGDIAFQPDFWRKVFRVLKPGAHLVAMGAPRNYHRLACAIEDAGFEIRDSLMWIYGTGFPKSHKVGDGWGTALKPAYEPIVLARKPISEKTVAANYKKWGTGGINIEDCRIESPGGKIRIGEKSQDKRYSKKGSTNFAVKPGPRGGGISGRWPANILTDGSEEVFDSFPKSNGQMGALKGGESSKSKIYGKFGPKLAHEPRRDDGSAARFFYSAKASKQDRANSKHPTVKPLALKRYLIRLVTPSNGTVLDPFAGTGTTGEAAFREGMKSILIEKEKEYQRDIRRRMKRMKRIKS